MTPKARHGNIRLKGGVRYMTKDDISRFTFRLPKSLLERLKQEAHTKALSVNSLIILILQEWVEEQ